MHRALKNFILYGERIKVGQKVDHLPKSQIRRLKENGCVYETKEEKRVYDRTTKAKAIDKGAGWYEIRKGNQIIDKVRGEEKANELVKEINEA